MLVEEDLKVEGVEGVEGEGVEELEEDEEDLLKEEAFTYLGS